MCCSDGHVMLLLLLVLSHLLGFLLCTYLGFSQVEKVASENTLEEVEHKEGEGLAERKGRKRKKGDSESEIDGESSSGTNFIQRNIEVVGVAVSSLTTQLQQNFQCFIGAHLQMLRRSVKLFNENALCVSAVGVRCWSTGDDDQGREAEAGGAHGRGR